MSTAYQRPSNERGYFKNDWLEARYSFSFSSYYNPDHVGFGPLIVINQDCVQPTKGFGFHSHDNMEIVTIVTSGELKHRDTLGNEALIKPGMVQSMSAGTGITHSEVNNSTIEPLKLLQIWIQSNKVNIKPKYEEIKVDQTVKSQLVCVASEEGQKGGVNIQADADIYWAELKAQDEVEFKAQRSGKVWIQVISGQINVSGHILAAGDGLGLDQTQTLNFKSKDQSQFLVFDLNEE